MKATGIILLLLVWQSGFSQWNDNFGDGDHEFNPSWSGITTAFAVENSVLRLAAPPVSGSSYLSTPSDNINNASWQLSVHLNFNPSSSNFVEVYLVADQMDLNSSLKGYFIKVGGSSDEISLYRQDGTVETEIIDGIQGRVSLSTVQVEVLVSRSEAGEWTLSSKLNSESNWLVEGSAIDNTYSLSNYFGIKCNYTSTRSDKFYFDNIKVTGTPYIDTDSPIVGMIKTQSVNQIDVLFNELILGSSASHLTYYVLNDIANPEAVTISDSSILLTFAKPLEVINKLSIKGILDLVGNQLADTVVQVFYIDSSPTIFGDIIFNEIMADPSPREDLPEVEYVELYNTSARGINMTGWSLYDKSTTAVLNDVVLLPDSTIIITALSDVSPMEPYGKVIGLSPWPSLNNTGDSITLVNAFGEVIDRLVYNESWYQDDNKSSGGWSLERIFSRHPCSGYLNWQASIDPKGGTPGKANSVAEEIDTLVPELLSYGFTKREVTLSFNEPLVEALFGITVNSDVKPNSIEFNYNQIHIMFNQDFATEQNNVLNIAGVEDCFGNIAADIKVNFTPDFSPPIIDTVYSYYPNTLEVYFSEAISGVSLDQFFLDGIGQAIGIVEDPEDLAHLSIEFTDLLVSGEEYVFISNNISDSLNNVTVQSQHKFIYTPLSYPQFGDLLITEIMADPTPIINLPEEEYIELLNTTPNRLLLKGIVLEDAKDKVEIPDGIIEPFERVILTKTSAIEDFSPFAKTIGLPNWLSLNNSTDDLSLTDPQQNLIHNVSYSSSWYDNTEKEEGGWSLELIDEKNYCAGERVWAASINLLGGTPGQPNSVQETIDDFLPPNILNAYTISNDSIEVQFNEPLNTALPLISLNNQKITNQFFSSYSRDKVIFPTETLIPRKIYNVTMSNFSDCLGNLNKEEQIEVLLPEDAAQGELLISELLFNPRSDGVDFIEVYNNSPKNISLSNWRLSNGSSTSIVPSGDLLKPYSYRALTSSPIKIIEEYPNAVSENIYLMGIPTMVNSSGKLVIRNESNLLMDSLEYNEDWHFSYLASVEGVSLERIDFIGSSYQASNWASAAATEDYATPGYKNSQARINEASAEIMVSPQIIAPDGDGRDDFTRIEINTLSSGALATISVYNLQGQLVRQIANNSLIGSTSGFRWDGTNRTGSVAPLGHYIILIEVILDNGTTKAYREKVVVAKGF